MATAVYIINGVNPCACEGEVRTALHLSPQ